MSQARWKVFTHQSYHIDVEDGHAEREIVLIEDTLKFCREQLGALCEAQTAPGVKGASLELHERERSTWALLLM